MNIPCRFENFTFDNQVYYGCVVRNQELYKGQETIFVGQHDDDKTNCDVTAIWFENCIMMKVPQGIMRKFPNLKAIAITSSDLTKITKNDIIEYKNLAKFICKDNELEFLPGDLFEDFQNLDFVDFSDNMLGVVEPNIIDGLENLKIANFTNNPNYGKNTGNILTYIYSFFDKNAFLNEVKRELKDNFPSRLSFLEDLRKSEGNLDTKNQQLRDEIEKLRNDMRKQKLDYSKSVVLQANLQADIRNFIQDEANKDLCINIGDRKFRVHKLIIAIRSPILGKVLREAPAIDNLNLTDVPVDTFEKILKFIYTHDFPKENDTDFYQLLMVAARFKITKLIEFAAPKVLPLINSDNALEILNLSIIHKLDELKQKSFDVVQKKYPEIGIKSKWMANSQELIKIVKVLTEKEEANQKYEEQLSNFLKQN